VRGARRYTDWRPGGEPGTQIPSIPDPAR
jgi:hypothetical protein